jgi:hypothetical protein
MRVTSPELVLVDEELAAWCRLRLCEEAAAEEARRAPRPSVAPNLSYVALISLNAAEAEISRTSA